MANAGVMRSFKLDSEIVEVLDITCRQTGRTRTFVLHEALRAYLEGRVVPGDLPVFRYRDRRMFFRPPVSENDAAEDAYRAGFLAGCRAATEDTLDHLGLAGKIRTLNDAGIASALKALEE